MSAHDLLNFVPLLGVLAWAAAGDVRRRRIPNALTLSLAAAGVMQSFLSCHTVTPCHSLLGFLAGFAITFVLFALGALGGGDVKLLAAVGAWVGPGAALAIFAVTAVLGMVIVLTQAAVTGRLRVLFRNAALLTVNLAHVGDVGVDHAVRTGQACRSVDKPLPYAVPVFLATIIVVLVIGR